MSNQEQIETFRKEVEEIVGKYKKSDAKSMRTELWQYVKSVNPDPYNAMILSRVIYTVMGENGFY